MTDLQSGIAISDDGNVTGTSKYVTGYTGYSGTTEWQEGNFLALHFAAGDDCSKITVQMIPGHQNAKELDDDGICVFRIEDGEQIIQVIAYYPDGQTVMQLSLDDLTLTPQT